MEQFVSGLKSRHEETRAKTARDLYHYVTTELREVAVEELIAFLDDFNHHIFEMVSSSDASEKKGGILAIVSLIGADVGNTNTRSSRFANYLRNLLPSTDTSVMELAAKAVGRVAIASGTYTSEYVDFEVKRAFEWLGGDRVEARRHAAVLVLRELALSTPTFFFQQVQPFFDSVFNAVRDPKPVIRESAVAAVQAALVVTAQRETKDAKQKLTWYKQCYDEVLHGFEEGAREKGVNRDDRVHGSLLVLNELLRCSYIENVEKVRQELDDIIQQQQLHERSYKDHSSHGRRKLTTNFFHQSHSLQQLQQKGNVNPFLTDPLGGGTTPRPNLVHSRTCHQLLEDNYVQICEHVLKQRHSRNPFIQHTLLVVLPRLAALDTTTFVRGCLGETMLYLLGCLKRDRERCAAFIAIGLLAVAVGDEIKPHLPKIMEVVKAALPTNVTPSKRKSAVVDSAIFSCISMLARAVRLSIKADVKEMLDSMFSVGLSPALTATLKELAHQIPQLKKDIQDGLLRVLSYVLMHRPLSHPGMPKHLIAATPTGAMPFIVDPTDVAGTTLALRTLGTFDFHGHSLMQFVRHCADHFLASEHKEIRMEAVRTCCRLLAPLLPTPYNPAPTISDADPASYGSESLKRQSSAVKQTVADVLSKLLVVGITDTDSDIRYCVLSSLDDCFDEHLAQAENLSALFVALNDEVFEIREIAICVVGRLSGRNPAYVMPSLRKTLIQILTELEHSGIGRNKEQAARMLGHLVSNAPRLIRPYMEPILKVLVPKLRDPDPNLGVVISVLAAVGEQAQVGGVEMRKYVPELLPIILEMLQDSSSLPKREVALWSLGQLVESIGYVVEPYHKYPNLLEVLLNFLKAEQSPGIRREALRVLGLLGALDPYKHKMNLGQIDHCGDSGVVLSMSEPQSELESSQDLNASELLVNLGSGATLDEFYPAVAIGTLMRVVRDPTLVQHHTMVVQAVTFIFKSLGIKCVPYLHQVMPSLLNVIRSSDNNNFREFLFQQLGVLIAIVKQHIRSYLDEIFAIIKMYWTVNSPLQNTIILLVENTTMALGAEFKIYLQQLIPHILKVFLHDSSTDKSVTRKLLYAIQKFGSNLDDFLHLLLPPIVKLFDSHDSPLSVRRLALETIDHLTECLDFTEFASRIIHPLVRTLDTTPDLHQPAIDTLCALVVQLGKKFEIFVPMVHKVMLKHKITHQRYDILTCQIIKGTTIAEEESGRLVGMRTRRRNRHYSHDMDLSLGMGTTGDLTTFKKLNLITINLQRAWTATRRVSKEDWLEWMRRFSVELLKESPSPALRSCWALAQSYNQLPKDLFNAAFVSCWTELSESLQAELIDSLNQALMVPDIPEITQTLLNLAEFMEHCDKGALPLDPIQLGERAMRCRAFAKALHYKEDEFHKGPTTEVLEALISINNKLQQPEAAHGILEYARKHHGQDLEIQERWYEKLHNWESALHAYEEKQVQNPDDWDLTLGRMRCLEAMGEWGQLHSLASEKWTQAEPEMTRKMSRMAAAAAWGLGNWDSLEQYTSAIPRDSQDGAFYRAVLCLHMDQYEMAEKYIDKVRDLLDTELTAMAGESYQRAYGAMVSVQMLSELEEVIRYKLLPERREAICEIWWNRLQGCQRVVEDWQKILQVHTLVVSPEEDVRSWLKYASLCRRNGRLALSKKTLVMLLGQDPSENSKVPLPTVHPHVSFAYSKHMWRDGHREDAFRQLHHLVQTSLHPLASRNWAPEDAHKSQELCKLLARCYLKLGEWQETLHEINDDSIPQVLQFYSAATEFDPNWYKAWHALAYINFEAVLFYKNQGQSPKPSTSGALPEAPDFGSSAIVSCGLSESPKGGGGAEGQLSPSQFATAPVHVRAYAVPAVRGFFRSVSLSGGGNSLQDTLRLLNLWFNYGQWSEVYDALVDGIKSIRIDTWLQVIPQLIARVDTPKQSVGRLIHQLLADIGREHPQALIYPLTVASKSTAAARHRAANAVLKGVCEHSCRLVHQALMVSEELVRVAILWHELWHEALEEASRLYFGERNIAGMFATLEPLHALIERGPQTLKEISFSQAYGRELMEALEWCKKYQRTLNVKDLTQAWDLYYHVFRRITKQLPQLTSLELQYVSPKLLNCRDLELAVPGSYDPRRPVIHIKQVQSSLQVITSKQRPRKLGIKGSNGKDFVFLLKGHEDLRQDERVMQLFGLVNTLLVNDAQTAHRNVTIQRYAVIPLSTNSGLIGWVPHCDTLHTLIRDYREKKKILLNIEHRIMLRMAPDYDHLTLMQKVEVFEHALEHTNGDDLARLLWLKSPSSEIWFDRRTNYIRSLAVMSIVGYILGLGDRHPSNLMLDRLSGKILHIDFGDCFEVAMTREKFPEKIPFRLTRMLINAMEVTGIEGTYRITCCSVLEVLRNNKDSLMAVLEAFVYDPLLNWRLMDTAPKTKRSVARSESISTGHDPIVIDTLEPVDVKSHEPSTKKVASSRRTSSHMESQQLQQLQQQQSSFDVNAAGSGGGVGVTAEPEALNEKALEIVNRVRDKLTGRDFSANETLDVPSQVELLIKQATSHENLCQCYIGWCPFW